MMNYNKILLSTLILSSSLLFGCSTNTKIGKLTSDVRNLNTKVNQISDDVNALRSDMQLTKEDATRANQRLDNQITSYHK